MSDAIGAKDQQVLGARSRRTAAQRFQTGVSPRNIGAVYFWVLIIVIFVLIAPTFWQLDTARQILNQYSVEGLVALGLIVPLSAAVFDLSVGYVVGFGGTLVAWLIANDSFSFWWAILITLGACLLIGAINGLIVVGFGINSFIATLASGSVVSAVTIGISGNKEILVTSTFSHDIARAQVWGMNAPVFYLLVLMIVLGLVMEKTPVGSYWYAIGFDSEVARLAGVRVKLLQCCTLLISAVIAGAAGIIGTAQLGVASPTVGPSYLLPAFAAAFLGATQLRGGRFNAWGTVIAVLLLGTGEFGILLAGGPLWSPDIFDGLTLIGAVGLTRIAFGAWPRLPRLPRWPRLFRRPGLSRSSETTPRMLAGAETGPADAQPLPVPRPRGGIPQ